jgi:hypothetical protein
MELNLQDFVRSLVLTAALFIVLCIDGFVIAYWTTYDAAVHKLFWVFNVVAIGFLVVLLKEEKWPLNILALLGAASAFAMIVPRF